MALFAKNQVIKEGDIVCLYESRENMNIIRVTKDGRTCNKSGDWNHNDLIGSEYGDWRSKKKATSPISSRMYLFRVSPDIWSSGVQTRTQIIFSLDISLVLAGLNVVNGSRVIESGTGSGSLTTSFTARVAPKGHVFTFEFNERRVQQARDDFELTGISDHVTVTHRNVYDEGFVVEGKDGKKQEVRQADAVFLDLPNPHLAIEHAHRSLRDLGRLCNFSPCIEQVQRAIQVMEKLGFRKIRTSRCSQRTYQSQIASVEQLDFRVPVEDVGARAKRREAVVSAQQDRKKRVKLGIDDPQQWEEQVFHPARSIARDGVSDVFVDNALPLVMTKPNNDSYGHTGFLTFAEKPVEDDSLYEERYQVMQAEAKAAHTARLASKAAAEESKAGKGKEGEGSTGESNA